MFYTTAYVCIGLFAREKMYVWRFNRNNLQKTLA